MGKANARKALGFDPPSGLTARGAWEENATGFESGAGDHGSVNVVEASSQPVESVLALGFVAGTLIKTRNGEIPVEGLRPGAEVLTMDVGYKPVLQVGFRHLSAGGLKASPELRPIRIHAGALGVNQPATDLILSPLSRVMLRLEPAQQMFGESEILTEAKHLLDMEGVEVAEELPEVTYWHFLLDGHQVAFSDGAPTETPFSDAEALEPFSSAENCKRDEFFTRELAGQTRSFTASARNADDLPPIDEGQDFPSSQQTTKKISTMMDINITLERPEPSRKSGPVTVGWFLDDDKSSVVMFPPERVSFRDTNKSHAKSAARCPGVVNLESRYFMIRCPYDIHIGFERDKQGKPVLVNRSGTRSSIRANRLGQVLHLVNESEWRYPDKPTIQLSLGYCFVAEEVCYITQLDSFAHYRFDPLPGTIFGGRFPIHAWVRPLMWAFEWHDTSKDLILRRGEPLCYCQFEADGPDRSAQVVAVERTPEIERWMASMQGVASLVNQTFSLFRAAEAERPKTLLKPKG